MPSVLTTVPMEPLDDAALPRSLAQQLRALREARGLSQEQLAQQAGVTLGSVQNWEQGACGRDGPGLWKLLRLAKFLGVSLESLAGLPGAMAVPLGINIVDLDVVERVRAAREIDELEDVVGPGISFAFHTPEEADKIRICSDEELQLLRNEIAQKLAFLQFKKGQG